MSFQFLDVSHLPISKAVFETRKKIFEQNQGSKQQAKTSKWSTSLDNVFKIDFLNAKPFPFPQVADSPNIDFANLKLEGVQRAEGGTEGLFFVSTTDGVMIVKRSFNIASEILAGRLAHTLGIYSPKVYPLDLYSSGGEALYNSMTAVEKTGRVTTTFISQKHVLIMEFLRGITLNLLDHTQAAEIFADTTLLTHIGSLMALDVLTNNSDRLPLIWSNQGNLSNVMITEQNLIVSIDAKIVPIAKSNTAIYGNYMRKLEQTVKALLLNDQVETSAFRYIRDVISAATGYDMASEGTLAMQKGFKETTLKALSLDVPVLLQQWSQNLPTTPEFLTSCVDFVTEVITLIKTSVENPSSAPIHEAPKVQKGSNSNDVSTKTVTINKAVVTGAIPEFGWKRVVVPQEKPLPRRYTTGVLHDHKLYVFGGMSPSKAPLNDLYYFDIDASTWHLVPPKGVVPAARYGHSAVIVNDTMLVYGGCGDKNQGAFGDVYSFSFASGEWKVVDVKGQVPPPRFNHSCVVHHSQLLVFGGSKDQSVHYDDGYVFDIDNATWTSLNGTGHKPSNRAGHLSFVLPENGTDYLYIFGGHTGKGGFDILADMSRLNLSNNTWEEVDASGILPRMGRPIPCIVHNGQVYTYGGYDGKQPQRTLLLFDPKDKKWNIAKLWLELDESSLSVTAAVTGSAGMEPTPRYGHAMVLDSKGVLTIFGGSGSTYLNDVMQIDTTPEDEDE